METDGIKWWGYLHTNGTIQVKRYFDMRDIQEARESVFVLETVGPFEVKDRDAAIFKAKELLR